MGSRLNRDFFIRDVLEVAPDLLGKTLVRRFDGSTLRCQIVEVEAYRGEEDLASHAHFGRTKRTEVMYGTAGYFYVYLVYGMYWLLNVVTGVKDQPQAVLIRALRTEAGELVVGSGKVGKILILDKSFYGEDSQTSRRLWFESGKPKTQLIKTLPRVGVGYAGAWKDKLWRFSLL